MHSYSRFERPHASAPQADRAMASISTLTSLGFLATWTHDLAGLGVGMSASYTAFMRGKSSMLLRKTGSAVSWGNTGLWMFRLVFGVTFDYAGGMYPMRRTPRGVQWRAR